MQKRAHWVKNKIIPEMASCQESCSMSQCQIWDIPLVTSRVKHDHHKYAVLILNRPITQSSAFLTGFWNNVIRVTVDGGTKQWDLFLNRLSEDVQRNMRLPDLITGDFDSIPEEVFDKYRRKGCEMVHTPDQDHTDFTKALIELHRHCLEHSKDVDHIVALGQSSGRLDQVLGNIQTLYLAKEKHLIDAKIRVYLMTDDAISWLLKPGEHLIHISKETLLHKRAWCSLVPIGGPCASVSTTGLKWNLDNQCLQFGDLVSTSNTFNGCNRVTVKCSHTVLWSMRIPSVSDSNT